MYHYECDTCGEEWDTWIGSIFCPVCKSTQITGVDIEDDMD